MIYFDLPADYRSNIENVLHPIFPGFEWGMATAKQEIELQVVSSRLSGLTGNFYIYMPFQIKGDYI